MSSDSEWQPDSQRVAARLLAALSSAGVRHFLLSPGSRSQALALAAAQLEAAGLAQLTVRLDERSLGFTALGIASLAEPAAAITTSGTAVANLHPAVLEAHHSGLPLIVLSADRPASLRGSGANQTTDQTSLFGPALRASFDFAANTATSDAAIDELVTLAMQAALGLSGQPGPVQLNLQFREPLSALEPNAAQLRPSITLPSIDLPEPTQLAQQPGTVVLAGAKAGAVANDFARAGGYPLFAEPSSQARFGNQLIRRYSELTEHSIANEIKRIVIFGKPTLHRRFMGLLARPEIELVVVHDRAHGYFNPTGRPATQLPAAVAEPGANAEWLAAWQLAERELPQPAAATELGRIAVIDQVWHACAEAGGKLLIGASELIRVADRFAPNLELAVFANRGLAGIDGTVSTAIGMALADSAATTRALIGDLTLLHDAASLNLTDLGKPKLQLIVVNDRGGRIFEKLEIAKVADPEQFERMFLTPQQVDIEALARAYGWHYFASTPSRLAEVMTSAEASVPALIEVKL